MDLYIIPLDYPLSVFRRLRAGTPNYGTNRKYGSHRVLAHDGLPTGSQFRTALRRPENKQQTAGTITQAVRGRTKVHFGGASSNFSVFVFSRHTARRYFHRSWLAPVELLIPFSILLLLESHLFLFCLPSRLELVPRLRRIQRCRR
jgi:hypothetical protein